MLAYSLPPMSRQEIISFLSEYQIITVSDSDLLNPNPNLLFTLYSSLLRYLDCLQEDVAFAALERIDNPEAHSDSVNTMILFDQIRGFLESIECPTPFTLTDLFLPDSNRTLKFLTAIINFCLHRNSKLSLFSSFGDELETRVEERKQKESIILQLEEEIEAIKEVREREKPFALEAEARVKELQQAVGILNNQQSNLRSERAAMKERAEELTQNVSTAEYELIQATEENAIWRSKIVHSPEKLQRALEEKKTVVTEAKDAERLAMQHFQEKTATLESYTKAWQKMTKQLSQMQAIQEQVNSSKSVEKDVKQLKAKLSDEKMLDISLEAKVTECEAKGEQLDKEKHQLEKDASIRRTEDTKGLENVKLEAESKKHDLEEKRRKIEALKAQDDAAEGKINSGNAHAAATQRELLRKGEEIVNEMNVYMSSMAQAMSRMSAAGS